MSKKALFIFLIFSQIGILVSCNNQKKKQIVAKNTNKILNEEDSIKFIVDSLLKIAKPVWGYRFEISGDFNGDGKKEILREKYISQLTKKETNKFYQNLPDYGDEVLLACEKYPYSFLISNDKIFDTLIICNHQQNFGLSYIKNEGDIDGDDGDEISYVINWADWSNLNTWHIVSYKNNKWVELEEFGIWDWQLPSLPTAINSYGYFGIDDKVIIDDVDTLNLTLLKELKAFKGLVKKLGNKKIQVTYRTDDAEEKTKIIKL